MSAAISFRSRNNFRTADSFTGEIAASYKPLKWLRFSAGYSLLVDNNREKLTVHEDFSYNNWRKSYWGTRHRVQVGVTGSYKVHRVTLSLREMWQYTYRPEKTNLDNFDFDEGVWEKVSRRGKGKNELRSRIGADWDIPHCKFTPFAMAEAVTTKSFDKLRLTVGTEYTLKRRHVFEAFYRYQHVFDDDDYDVTSHIIGVGYRFRF